MVLLEIDMSESPAQLVRQFFENYPTAHLGKGQIIMRPGDDIKKVPYLEAGSIIQYDISSVGNIVIVNSFKPGAFFPMSSVMNQLPTDYFFEAASPATIRLAPASRVIEFMDENPSVAYDLLSRVYKGLDGVLGRMVQLMGGSATSRLVYELINTGYRFGEVRSDGSRFLQLSESDIAKRAGLTRETVNRVGRELKEKDLMRVSIKGIEIPDIVKLEELLGSLS